MNKKYFFMVLALIIISLPGFAAIKEILYGSENLRKSGWKIRIAKKS
jgi:hypothetical protein